MRVTRILAVIAVTAAAAVQARAQTPDAVEAFVAAERERQQVPGLAVAVVRGGDVLSARGYGWANVEHQVPVTRRTVFQSGSLGKQFTAVAVMLQVEDGKLALDDPLTRFFPDAPPAWRDVTVRHLLTHTSGLPDYLEGAIDYRRDYTEDELVRLAYGLELEAPPGARWSYSNTGYVLLGVVVRRASGRFYGDVLRERVFAPLGMTSARVISEADIVPHRAAGYSLEAGELKNQEWVSPSLNTTADGALYLSLDDLIAWDRGLRRGALLSPGSWAAIFEPMRLTGGRRYPYGFGWSLDQAGGHPVHRHGGSWQGFEAYIARYRGDDLTIVALANLAQAEPGRIVEGVAGLLNPGLQARAPLVIVGAQVADGTGAPLMTASVRVEGDRIQAVGAVEPRPGDEVVDATGLVLAPGFIDVHNHSTEGLARDPRAVSQVSQGITTLVVGQDGQSPWPIQRYLDERRAAPAAVNVAVLAGHATLRREVMADDFRRAARPEELSRMEALLEQGLREGALGLSSGLEYEVGSYATTDELVALAQVAARRSGVYVSHIRDEADRTLEAVDEAVAIGERAGLPVQITHIKLGTVGVWRQSAEVVRRVEAARSRGVDVTADAYPYLAWQSSLKVLVPSRRWTDPADVREALADVGGGRNIQIVRLPLLPQHAGRRLDQAARAEGLSEVDFYIKAVADPEALVIGHTLHEDDLRAFYSQPWVMVASDGGIANSHPRGAGTFPRVLGRLVREQGWLTLAEAIRKMTSLPAQRLGLADRGRIAEGWKADLVLFDPALVADRATFEVPRRVAIGIETVWVNGVPVWAGNRPGRARPGVVLTR